MARRSPTMRQRRLIYELKRLRAASGLSQQEVAAKMEWSVSKQEKLEIGAIGVRIQDMRGLLDVYGAHGDEREVLLQLVRDARKRGWWHAYGEAIPSWFTAYVDFEHEAASIRTYEIHLIPGLLQTEDYARTLMRARRPEPAPEEVDRMVAARMERQSVLTKPDPLRLWVILDEAALFREVGGRSVMHTQLRYVAEVARLPNVTLQVLPSSAGAHTSMGTNFILLEFPEPGDPDVVYLEDLTSSAYLEDKSDIHLYSLAFDHLRSIALPDSASAELIKAVAKDLAE